MDNKILILSLVLILLLKCEGGIREIFVGNSPPSTCGPTVEPTIRPTTFAPTFSPTKAPRPAPSRRPTSYPTSRPTSFPTITIKPSPVPTSRPTNTPSSQPSRQPSSQPTGQPTSQPTTQPSSNPTNPTGQPTSTPTNSGPPTSMPTSQPTGSPSNTPKPTVTRRPTTARPSRAPSPVPSARPTAPTVSPTRRPTGQPTGQPSTNPSAQPSSLPTTPTSQPSSQPSSSPIAHPTSYPTFQPISDPTSSPSTRPTSRPTRTHRPSGQPTGQPTGYPSTQPSSRPTSAPTFTRAPTTKVTASPSGEPTSQPSSQPSTIPSASPTTKPTNPTGQPSSSPSGQPSRQPTGQPSAQPFSWPTGLPSSQPSAAPTNPTGQPSTQPSSGPTGMPTSRPTYTHRPTCFPTGQPTSVPSGQPTGIPTVTPTQSMKPTFRPTSRPTSRPTGRPTEYFADTPRPTAFYETIGTVGSVTIEPDRLETCLPVEVTIEVSFSQNLTVRSSFQVYAEGITSGVCTGPFRGQDIFSMTVRYPSTYAEMRISYFEGSPRDNFAGSYFNFLIIRGYLPADNKMTYVIDRSNLLRRSCSANSSWIVSVAPALKTSGFTGYLPLQEKYPKAAFAYTSGLNFSNPHQQMLTDVTVSLHLAFPVRFGTVITISLPGFTNRGMARYPLNPMGNFTTVPVRGRSGRLSGIESTTSFSWSGQWVEGSFSDNYSGSRLILTANGALTVNEPFQITIPKSFNQLVAVCGHIVNAEKFRLSVSSTFFEIENAKFSLVQPIGSGCDQLNKCNFKGECDYCTSTCRCFDGFGSAADRRFSVADDFAPDCSSRTCPVGPSMGSIVTEFFNNTNRFDMDADWHRPIECSNNGVCDRSTGRCICRDGFTGPACQRMKCPGKPTCSGRGRCVSMGRLPDVPDALPLTFPSTRRNRLQYLPLFNTSWDFDFGHMCVCDSSWKVGLRAGETQQAEFFGPACEFRRCPSGDDPATPQIDETNCKGKAMTGGTAVGETGNKCHVDCSNRGICDYLTGQCRCFKGYKGANCGKRFVKTQVIQTGDASTEDDDAKFGDSSSNFNENFNSGGDTSTFSQPAEENSGNTAIGVGATEDVFVFGEDNADD